MFVSTPSHSLFLKLSAMELQCAPTVSRKLRKILKLAFFMMKNGLVSKRKLMLMDVNLLLKRGKLLGKSLRTLMSHHQQQQARDAGAATSNPNGHVYGPDEYEFSCSNTPNPVFLPTNSRRKHSYFPCIGAPPVDEQDEYKATMPAERRMTPVPSPFSVRISNCSMAEEAADGLRCEVDSMAEEFIKRFYRQLHAQGRINAVEEN